jgi:hypothetical protein
MGKSVEDCGHIQELLSGTDGHDVSLRPRSGGDYTWTKGIRIGHTHSGWLCLWEGDCADPGRIRTGKNCGAGTFCYVISVPLPSR